MSAHMSPVSPERMVTEVTEGPIFYVTIEPKFVSAIQVRRGGVATCPYTSRYDLIVLVNLQNVVLAEKAVP
eukprot:779545-Alexandrium_andersonii.AAC.1